MVTPSAGVVRLGDVEASALPDRRRARLRATSVGFVFQDPATSLNPRLTVGECIAEPLVVHKEASGQALRDRVNKLLDDVQLAKGTDKRYPHELSGGQRQQLAIARALITRPKMLLLDEPTSSMDNASEEAFKANLSRISAGKTILVVTHRTSLLSLVDRIIVMDAGRVVADGPRDTVVEALRKGQIGRAS